MLVDQVQVPDKLTRQSGKAFVPDRHSHPPEEREELFSLGGEAVLTYFPASA